MMHSVWIGSNRTELYTKIIKKFGKISGMVRCEKIQFHCISKESKFDIRESKSQNFRFSIKRNLFRIFDTIDVTITVSYGCEVIIFISFCFEMN
jgi:hypothetical protein